MRDVVYRARFLSFVADTLLVNATYRIGLGSAYRDLRLPGQLRLS